ncbi:REP-associated tyrosine transposase [Klebsiella aerogenes]|uniref:REP-associated tyrosine transposase n=1 Tax=Klebsiella aerogenes TaxID=548 RepID=UPI0021D30AA3|nr:transposase [Klebsiella aerogenes]MCU6321066.1 transposase [Klebsiella aerogenes]
MSNYRRSYIPGGCWFFTVNLQNRHSDLLTRHIDHLRAAIACTKRKRPFQINSWVVLPEHMHCIWTLPEGDSDYSGRWREIKKSFTRALAQSQIWQPRFWEHTIRNDEDYRRHMDYVYINPVKHRLVGYVRDWPYSTFHRDVRKGLYPEDWAGDTVEIDAGERR